MFRVGQQRRVLRKPFHRFHGVLARALGFVVFAQAKQLTVAVEQFVNIIAALGKRNTEIVVFNILLMRLDTVDSTDIRGIFFRRE